MVRAATIRAAQEIDVASATSVERAVRLAGEMDILINNAGITSADSALDIDLFSWRWKSLAR